MAGTTNCAVCGVSCLLWGPDSYSCCSSCAPKVMAHKEPGRSIGVFGSYNPKNGDGFPKNHWAESVAAVKSIHLTGVDQTKNPEVRRLLAERIISILKEHVYPYGGYVRDFLAGEKEFNDLDLFMPRFDKRWDKNVYQTPDTMAQLLRNNGLVLRAIPSAKEPYSHNSKVHLTKQRYEVTDSNGVNIEIDLVKTKDAWQASDDHPYPSLDADVNSLAFDKEGKPWAVTGLPLADVLDNIANKVFNVPSDSTIKGERVNKLLAKGYRVSTPINLTTLEEGDEVIVTIRNQGKLDRRDAVVLRPASTKHRSAVVAFKEAYQSNDGYASSGFYDPEVKTTAKKLGVDTSKYVSWEVGDDYTKIEKIVKRARDKIKFSKENAAIGTSVRCVYSSYPEFIGKTATVVRAKDFSIQVKWDDGTDHNTEFSSYSSFALVDESTVKKEKSIVKKITVNDLQEGDRVRLTINDTSTDYDTDEEIGEVEREATFIREDDSGSAIFVLDESYDSDEMSSQYVDDIDNPELSRYIAEKYVEDVDSQLFWTVESTSYEPTTISKILSHQTANPKKQKKKEEKQKTMPYDENGTKMSLLDIVQQDAGKAAIRSGATLGINGLKAGIEKVLAHEGVDGPGAQAVMKFFSGPVGEALLRGSLGYGLLYLPIPMIQENEYAQKVSEELRVSGMSKGMDKAGEMVSQFIVPALLEAFKNTPLSMEALMGAGEKKEEATKPRVASPPPLPQRVAPQPEALADEDIEVEFEETNRQAARAAV